MKVNLRIGKRLLPLILFVYIILLFKLIILKYMPLSMFIEEMIDSPVWHLLPRPFEQCNFIPLNTIKLYINGYGLINQNIIINNILGNILLFIPVGLLAELSKIKRNRAIAVFIGGFVLSLVFEVLQYISGMGICDVDDVILNTFGVLIGIIIGLIVIRILKRNEEKMED